MMVGMKVDVEPIPPILENTKMFAAGAVSFGVEYRLLNDQIAAETYGADRLAEMRKATEYYVPNNIDDSGVSIHVYGKDGREYLRFDCFREDPHYHYILPDETYQRVVPYDAVANGDPLAWTLTCLRGRLAPMLREAGAAASADQIDPAQVNATLEQVEKLARAVSSER